MAPSYRVKVLQGCSFSAKDIDAAVEAHKSVPKGSLFKFRTVQPAELLTLPMLVVGGMPTFSSLADFRLVVAAHPGYVACALGVDEGLAWFSDGILARTAKTRLQRLCVHPAAPVPLCVWFQERWEGDGLPPTAVH